MQQRVTVRVPGSTSNLGSGFDCVGLAVPLWLTLTVESANGTGTIERQGTLAGMTVALEDDLLYQGFAAAARAVGKTVPAVSFRANSEIPVARGLGSSAAAVIAGAVAASALLDLDLSNNSLAAIGTEIEHHPDNVAPMVYGGATLVLPQTGAELQVARLTLHDSLALVFAVPNFTVETRKARAALPATVSHRLASEAAARGAALIYGLATGDPRALAAGFDGVLHVPYRRSLVRGYDEVTSAARGAGAFGATLSGSGPTIVAVTPPDNAQRVGDAMRRAWDELGVRTENVKVNRPAGPFELA
jgi:homoserine kinase